MPLEQIRLLSILVFAAAVFGMFSGDLDLYLFVLLIAAPMPLWFDINLERVRAHFFWRVYGYLALALVGLLFALNFPFQLSVFLLVLFCIIYEFYGERRRTAPIRLISLLSFLIVIYQARIGSGLNLVAGLVVYLYAIVWCLYAFHAGQIHGYQFRVLARLGLVPCLRLTVIVIIIGLCFFWILPRFPSQNLSTVRSLGGSRLSGFAEHVTLTDIGSLKLSRKHVMDLKPLNGLLHTRYLKGQVLDEYHNGVWSSSVYAVYYPLPSEDRQYRLRDSTGQIYQYQVDMEALHGNPIFFTNTVVELKGVPQPVKVVGGADHISIMRGYPMALSYSFKATDAPLPVSSNVATTIYMQMPKGQGYFKEIGDKLVNPSQSKELKVATLCKYLQQNLTYSLDIHNQGVEDPLKEFLLNRKEGHCELFASALVMLCRAQGIHARLVTGFYIPEPHASGQFHYITESDAHAWVEVLYEKKWHVVDPTPTANLSEPLVLESQLAYLKHFWRSKVITWNYDTQRAAYVGLREYVGALWTTVKAHLWLMLQGLVTVMLLMALLRFQIRNKDARLAKLYDRLNHRLQSQFRPRSVDEGIYPFVRDLALPTEILEAVVTFLDAYHHYRFSAAANARMLPQLIKQGRQLLRQLKHVPMEKIKT